MRILVTALLYLTLTAGANAEPAKWEALLEGDMRKLRIHSEPLPGSDVAFIGEDGSEMTLADYEGRHVVLNFWATWCAPCRHEMPMLSDLAKTFDPEVLSIVTVATGRNPRPAMQRFFGEIGVDNLPLHTDERQSLARSLGVLGLPVTLILDPEGNEIARLQGEADWSSDSALAVLNAIAAGTSGPLADITTD